MSVDKWSHAEKKIARQAFDAAQQREFAALIEQIKGMAIKLSEPPDTWDLHHFLSRHLRDIEQKYDYRYSQLILVFARLMRDKWLTDTDIEGLAEDKRAAIREIASL